MVADAGRDAHIVKVTARDEEGLDKVGEGGVEMMSGFV